MKPEELMAAAAGMLNGARTALEGRAHALVLLLDTARVSQADGVVEEGSYALVHTMSGQVTVDDPPNPLADAIMAHVLAAKGWLVYPPAHPEKKPLFGDELFSGDMIDMEGTPLTRENLIEKAPEFLRNAFGIDPTHEDVVELVDRWLGPQEDDK